MADHLIERRLGIDIGTTRIRVALVALAASGVPTIENVASRETPAGAVVDGRIVDAAAIGRTLRDAVDELSTTERRCILALGEDVARLWVGPFPRKGNAKNRQAAADFQARLEFPELVDNDVKVATVIEPHPTSTDSIFAVVRVDAVTAAIAAARAAGLRPIAVDHQALALQRAFIAGVGAGGARAVAALDVGLKKTRFYGFPDGAVIPLIRTDAFGGATLTQEVADSQGIALDLAEERKRSGEGIDAFSLRPLLDFVERFMPDFRKAGAVGADPSAPIVIALTGNGAKGETITSLLNAETPYTFGQADLSGIASALPESVIEARATDIALAVGCALWGTQGIAINLLSADKGQGAVLTLLELASEERLRAGLVAVACAIAVMIGTGVIQSHRLADLQRQEQIATRQDAALQAQAVEARAFNANVDELNNLDDFIKSRRASARIYRSEIVLFGNEIAPHTLVTKIVDSGDGWQVFGVTRDMPSLANSLTGLASVPGVSNARFGTLTPKSVRIQLPPSGQSGPATATPPPVVSFEIDLSRAGYPDRSGAPTDATQAAPPGGSQ